jgi:hypothetical protein
MGPLKEFSNGQSGYSAITEGKCSRSVRAIYGEPISAQGKTVIPVARVMYAYGAGAGTGGVGDTSARGEGGGGGGGGRADSRRRYRDQRPADPFRSDHRPNEADGCGISGNRFGYVVGLAQAALSRDGVRNVVRPATVRLRPEPRTGKRQKPCAVAHPETRVQL